MRIALIPAVLILAAVTLSAAGEEAPRRDLATALAVREVMVCRDADAVVIGKVVEIHESPGIWCGILKTTQEVTYEIVESVDGESLSGEVRVGHLLVSGSAIVSKHAPFLRPDLIHPGARAILFLQRAGDGWEVRDETFGVRLLDPPGRPDPDVAAILRLVLDLRGLQEYLHPGTKDRVPVVVRLTDAIGVPPVLEKFGKEVRFLPAEVIHGAPFLEIRSLDRSGDRAEVRFAYAVEGVVGQADLNKVDGRWRIVRSKIAER